MSIKKNSVYNFLGSIVPLFVSIVTIPIYLNLVGIDRYGVLSISWIFLGYFGLFDLGLGRATTQRIAVLASASSQQRADSFWTALCLNISVGAIGAVLLWGAMALFFLYGFQLEPELRAEAMESLPLLAASVPVATITGVLIGGLQGRERFGSINLISTVSTIAFQVLPLIVIMFSGPRLAWVLASAIMIRIIAAIVLWRQCRQEFFSASRGAFKSDEVKSLLKFGGWVTVTALFAPLLVLVDRLFIGSLIGPQAVATYSIAIQLAQRMTLVAQALTGATFPRLAGASREVANLLSRQSAEALIALLTPVAVIAMFLCGPFFRLWLGANFDPLAVPIAQLMILGFWINSLAFVPFVRLQAVGRPDLVSYALVVEMPLYLGLLWFGMANFGVIGSAIALAIRLLIDFTFLSALARQFAAPTLTMIAFVTLAFSFALAPHDGSLAPHDILVGLAVFVGTASWIAIVMQRKGVVSIVKSQLMRTWRRS